jgi:hypothetical protein
MPQTSWPANVSKIPKIFSPRGSCSLSRKPEIPHKAVKKKGLRIKDELAVSEETLDAGLPFYFHCRVAKTDQSCEY